MDAPYITMGESTPNFILSWRQLCISEAFLTYIFKLFAGPYVVRLLKLTFNIIIIVDNFLEEVVIKQGII